MDRYGTLGGRSRNGWGSFSLIPQADDKGVPTFQSAIPKGVFRTWDSALELDWPHAIGLDDSGAPLVWQTRPFDDWKVMMRELAMIKIGLRTQFAFPNEKPPHMRIELRHWLSYPVTKHPTKKWKGSARLPNSLRFKARPDNDYPQKVRGVVYHMPCLPPPEFSPQPEQIKLVWRQVHAFLDAHDQLERISV
jgi:CRISPR-associated protein Cmr1